MLRQRQRQRQRRRLPESRREDAQSHGALVLGLVLFFGHRQCGPRGRDPRPGLLDRRLQQGCFERFLRGGVGTGTVRRGAAGWVCGGRRAGCVSWTWWSPEPCARAGASGEVRDAPRAVPFSGMSLPRRCGSRPPCPLISLRLVSGRELSTIQVRVGCSPERPGPCSCDSLAAT